MNDQSFTTTIAVDQTPAEAFAAINNVRGWWSEEIEGSSATVGDEFKYHFADVHRCTIRVTESVVGRRVVWLVVDNYFSFTEDRTEWTNTEVVFEIVEKDGKTEIRFTHLGLVPEYECFDVCSQGWGTYINSSLRNLITTGKGQPNADQRPTTEAERALLESPA